MNVTGTQTVIDGLHVDPHLTVLELAIVIVATRRPQASCAQMAEEIERWFRIAVTPQDVELPLHRMISRDCMRVEERGFEPTESGRFQAEQTARALIRLVFRDRFFFDVGKLLDVIIVKEDTGHA